MQNIKKGMGTVFVIVNEQENWRLHIATSFQMAQQLFVALK
jgi:hypothetical protein